MLNKSGSACEGMYVCEGVCACVYMCDGGGGEDLTTH